MATMDLKDAFYTVLIHPYNQNFLKYKSQEHCCGFKEMLNGYSEAMRVLKKLPKPPFSILRSYLSVVYVDNS